MSSTKIGKEYKLFQTFLFIVLISLIMSLVVVFFNAMPMIFYLVCYMITFSSIMLLWVRFIDRPYLSSIFITLIVSICASIIWACFILVSFSIFCLVNRLVLLYKMFFDKSVFNSLLSDICFVLGIIIATGILYWIFAFILHKCSVK
jgi:hypothetical protein